MAEGIASEMECIGAMLLKSEEAGDSSSLLLLGNGTDKCEWARDGIGAAREGKCFHPLTFGCSGRSSPPITTVAAKGEGASSVVSYVPLSTIKAMLDNNTSNVFSNIH